MAFGGSKINACIHHFYGICWAGRQGKKLVAGWITRGLLYMRLRLFGFQVYTHWFIAGSLILRMEEVQDCNSSL